MPAPLLMTKLFIPAPGKTLVERARLADKLNGCLQPGCRLTLVSAPAGFGKTTLISSWLAASGVRAAWLSLDDEDNDPVIFWTYLITALQTVQAGLGQQALNLLSAQGGEIERKLAVLINDLAQPSQPGLLVLDDYHLIRSPLIHQSLGYFVEHLPPRMHLLVASRTDPPLPLALLRGRGQLLEIRQNDLRFSDEDARAYLNAGAGLRLDSSAVHTLNQKTEGWAAGLQMAALALRAAGLWGQASATDPEKAAGFITSFSGSNRFILDYLIEEVLNRQPEPIQDFLARTSILDPLCGPLCDALLPGVGAQAVLEYLETSNLFIVPLDQQRYWYRYHHLFADLLRKRLAQMAPAAIPELHRRAVEWYEQNGLIPQAIQHAFQLGDFHKAAALVAQVTETLWGRGEHATLLAWMDALPDEEKKPYPHLLTFQVSMLISAGRLKEAEACIPILERYIAASLETNPNQPGLAGQVSELRTYIASFYGDRQAVFTHAQAALRSLTRDLDLGKRAGVCLILGHAYLTEGNLAAAGQAFEEACAAAQKAQKPFMRMSGLANLAYVRWQRGSLSQAEPVCREGLRLVEQHGLERSPMGVEIFLAWGEILSERGALAEAEPYIQRGLAYAQEQGYIWQVAWGYQAEARLRWGQGRLAEAESAAQAADRWAGSHEVPEEIACAAAGLLAALWLRLGKIDAAERCLRARSFTDGQEVHFPHQSEALALARLKWMQADQPGAARSVEQILAWAETAQHTRTQMEARLLGALQGWARGESEAALAFLEPALALVEPDGTVRVFVNEGEAMRALLAEALRRGIHSGTVRQLLDAFPGEPGVPLEAVREIAPKPAEPVSSETFALVEPLSRRELETLQWIAAGCSNKEIAQKLSISLRTVKYYSTGLYNKLGVDSRMQAVNRARELGLL